MLPADGGRGRATVRRRRDDHQEQCAYTARAALQRERSALREDAAAGGEAREIRGARQRLHSTEVVVG